MVLDCGFNGTLRLRARHCAKALQFFQVERKPFIQFFAQERSVDPFTDEIRVEEISRAKGCIDLSAVHLKDAHASVGRKFALESVAACVVGTASGHCLARIAELVNGGSPLTQGAF